jgi:ribosomal protein S18 acetylase RimI-like enzyme
VTALTLRPMTPDELAAYGGQQADGYARQMVEFGGLPEEDAALKAKADMERLWPNGEPAQGHHLFTAEVEDGQVVGHLWLCEQSPSGRPGQAWIYDIEVLADHRGKGYGRDLMLAARDEAKRLGCTNLGLNVFGGNDVAIRLYQSLGFRTTNIQMSKPL